MTRERERESSFSAPRKQRSLSVIEIRRLVYYWCILFPSLGKIYSTRLAVSTLQWQFQIMVKCGQAWTMMRRGAIYQLAWLLASWGGWHLVAQHLCNLHLSTNDTRTHGLVVIVQALSGVFLAHHPWCLNLLNLDLKWRQDHESPAMWSSCNLEN